MDLMYGTGLKEKIAVPEYIKKLKGELLEAYALVRERCLAEYKRMKNIYARKVYGEPFIIVAISSGYIPQLYHPGNPGSFTSLGKDRIKYWKGPYKVLGRFGETTLPTTGIKGGKPQIVHFDRLKACLPNIRLANNTPPKSKPTEVAPPQQRKIGSYCQLIDDDGDTEAMVPAVDPPAGHHDPPPVATRQYPDREIKE